MPNAAKDFNPFCLLRNEHNKKLLLDYLKSIPPSNDNPLCVYVGRWNETRSQKQNRYLWGWIYSSIEKKLNDSGQLLDLSDDRSMEWTKELLHEALKFLRQLPPIETKKGEITMHESTSSMNKKRFSQYIQDIHKVCHTYWHIEIPEPLGIWSDYHRYIF